MIFFLQGLETNQWTPLVLRLRIIYKSSKDLCTTTLNGSLIFVTGYLSWLNGISDCFWEVISSNKLQKNVSFKSLVRNEAMPPKLTRNLPLILNNLTQELNPSAQLCLTRFCTGNFASWNAHFVNICGKNQQMQQLLIQFINYVW
jgi:hypothetical protein